MGSNHNDDLPYLTVSETAAILRISDGLVRRLYREHKLPGIRLGERRIVFDKEGLHVWLKERAEANVKSAQAILRERTDDTQG